MWRIDRCTVMIELSWWNCQVSIVQRSSHLCCTISKRQWITSRKYFMIMFWSCMTKTWILGRINKYRTHQQHYSVQEAGGCHLCSPACPVRLLDEVVSAPKLAASAWMFFRHSPHGQFTLTIECTKSMCIPILFAVSQIITRILVCFWYIQPILISFTGPRT